LLSIFTLGRKYYGDYISNAYSRNNHNDTYVNPNATIFMTVGTAGAKQYGFTGQAPYIAQQFIRHGFVDV
jgi:hypothetical protein